MILVVTSLHLGASTAGGAGKLSEEDTNVVTEPTGVPALKRERQGSWLIGLTSFLSILLQSACTAVMAISGPRLLIGLGSLAAASFVPGFIFSIHTEKIRLPMMAVPSLGQFSIFTSCGEFDLFEHDPHLNGERSRLLPNNAGRRQFKSCSLF